ncbi:glycosyltransferase family 4 protein [Neoroseomonas rubea]|uniref:glycosyltransferase family 4 protein n=1 Tax=Neoroseomonas rubea TaxID=2748666 RepID=UPI0018E04361|nr:glycosyltransferase family 1 protein [Roseomonas rubea]
MTGAMDSDLARADQYRDQRLWDAAITAYRAHLDAWPQDWRARIQLGHCLKEAGDPAAALVAYRAAAAVAPNSPDVHLQMGHALKLLGEASQAWRAYMRALELDPDNHEAAREAGVLARHATPVAASARAPGQPLQVVFDSSDLVAYVNMDRTPTGIQRVQLSLTARALLDPIEGVAPSVVAFDEASGAWREIGRDVFLRLWRLSRTGGEASAPAWRAVVEEVRAALREGQDFAFAPGASLVNLGTSWWIKDYFLRVRDLVRQVGVRYVPLVYDCIPLVAPEHCQRALVEEFAQWFSGMVALADHAFAISEWSAADARRIAAEIAPERPLPITVVPLDADLRQDIGAAAAPDWPARADLPDPGEPFILCVGTIESRKNHLMLFQAWLALIRRHGVARMPRLVCVGKAGWLAEAATTLLANSPDLQERVSIAHGVPDVALAALYAKAMFTVTNSFYEGWGLPVTESLSFGRIPLVARNTSLTEAGGEAAVYFEPQNVPDLVSALEGLIFDAPARAARERLIAETVRLRSWGDIADQVMREVAARARAGAAPTKPFPVEPGRTYRLGLVGGGRAGRAKAMADQLRDGPAWHPLEPWGCWTRPGVARLRLPLPAGTEGPLRLYIGCATPAPDAIIRLRAHPEGKAPPRFAALAVTGSTPAACVLELDSTGHDILVEIDSGEGIFLPDRPIEAVGAPEGDDSAEEAPPPPGRMVGLGVTGVMVCRADDAAARLDFLESQAFRILRPE